MSLSLMACSISSTPDIQEPPSNPTNIVQGKATRTSNPRPTSGAKVTATTEPTSTPSGISIDASEIEGLYSDNYVVTAFWPDDEMSLYYAYIPCCGQNPLEWAAFDLATRTIVTITSPLKYDPSLWEQLDLSGPFEKSGIYPELRGYVSPSGKKVIYSVEYGDVSLGSTDPLARKEFWIADISSHHRIKILDGFLLGDIGQADWFSDETGVIFDYGYEGGVTLYIANLQDNTTVSLADVSDFDGTTEQTWALSPDGTSLAIIDNSLELWLVSLEDGTSRAIERSTRYPFWSKDGNMLYFWRVLTDDNEYALHSYDLASERTATVVTESSLAGEFDALAQGRFAVSPSGDKIAIWAGWLWLVEIHK